jgi:bifunctional UDP-N-acetylglucosamine pyrophosphorylase/glucosamine-1-phosphate N-acetyltransferase
MKARLHEAGDPVAFEPLTVNRPLGACPVANRPLRDAQQEELRRAGCSLDPAQPGEPVLILRDDAWCSAEALAPLVDSGTGVLRDAQEGVALAWIGPADAPSEPQPQARTHPEAFLLRHAWDLLRVNELLLGRIHDSCLEGILSPSVVVDGRIVLGKGSVILPGVYIEGTVLIGQNTRVGPNAYLRGPTAIGDECRIGQAVELKNSILMAGTTVAHLSYCGDSILGERVNLGGGTITANLRHDQRLIRTEVAGRLINTGRRKCGAILGDGVHTGIHTSLYPGRKLWPGATTRPGEIVTHDLRPGDPT